MDANRPIHPIAVVAARTGLSVDVIRVWERRYGAVEPIRDEAGRRLYTDADVVRLQQLARATGGGRGIGSVVDLTSEELEALIRADEEASGKERVRDRIAGGEGDPGVVSRALDLAIALDGNALRAVLRRAALLQGIPGFLEHTVSPLFRRIGEEWHAGRLSVAQEHLASGVASALIAELAAGTGTVAGAPSIVVATPSGELHQIGALMVAALASAEGWRVVYLGADVPAKDIVQAARDAGARCVALSAVHIDGSERAQEMESIRAGLPVDVDVLVGGEASAAAASAAGVRRLTDLDSFRRYLSERR